MSRLAGFVLIAAAAMVVARPLPAQEDSQPLDVAGVAAMLESGMPQAEILAAVDDSRQILDLSPGDVLRLEQAGAAPDLILALAGARVVPQDESLQPGALTDRRVLKMHRSGVAPATIVGLVSRYGLSAPPDPHDLVGYLAEGVPPAIVRALAAGGRGSSDGAAAPRLAGTMRAVSASALSAGTDGSGPEEIAWPGQEPENEPVRRSPTPEAYDRLWLDSVPPGARVFVSPRGTYREESFRQAHAVGETPLSLQLEPGEYQVTFVKQAGSFEDSLLPAWRTMYDTAETRTILDNAQLVFDPDDCCLPSSLNGQVNIVSISRDQQRTIIGDQFGGLPPYLFDGEITQLLDVRDSRIRSAIKSYAIRKNPGQSRILVATFLPAEGDPLEPANTGLGADRPYAATLDSPGLEFLGTSEGLEGCAALLGVDAGRLERAVGMLAQAGKAIIDQPAGKGHRIVSLALDDYGRLRLRDQTISPADLFAAPEPHRRSRKASKTIATKPPLLPEVGRVVVPGIGLPRLVVTNGSPRGAALHFEDGPFYYVPAGTTREVIIDPGTFLVRLLGAGSPSESPQERLHFAYHARYSISIP